MSKGDEGNCLCGEHSGISEALRGNGREHVQMQAGITQNSNRIDGMKNLFIGILCSSALQLVGIIAILYLAIAQSKGN